MPALLFNNVWMLAGLAALAVPVLIHLLLRRKKKRLRFSTLQFFVRQDEQSSQRRRLRNWLLLALRLLICTLLVLAFARPYWNGNGTAGGLQKRQVVVILDRSLSMQANAADGPKWARAKESVRQILSELKPDDRAALIGCAGQAEVLSTWAPSTAVTKLLGDLQPTFAAANLGEGLTQARRLLSMGDAKAASLIYLVSDLQRTSCPNLAGYPVPRDIEVKLVKVGDLVTPNCAVADLQLEDIDSVKPHAVVASFSDEDNPSLRLEVNVDGKVISNQELALSAGAATNVDFALPALKPGWHEVVAQLRGGHDSLTQDNARYQCIFTPEPTHVLIAEEHPSKRIFEEESFFVMMALDPGKDSTNSVPSRFSCEKLSADELATRLAHRSSSNQCDLVVLPGLKQVPAALGMALTSFVQAGGGLLMFVGDGVSANRYNSEFREVLPAPLGNQEVSESPETDWRIGHYDTNNPGFAVFQAPNSGDLSLPRFGKRLTLPAEEPKALVASFGDGLPVVLTRSVGHGRVVLVNSSADTSWNDWAKHKTFVPWLHGTAHYLAGLEAREKIHAQSSLLAGGADDVDLGSAAAKGIFSIRPAGGKEVVRTADDRGELRDLPFTTPGIYSVRDQSGKEARRIAVNVPTQESDLSTLPANDFQQQIARVADDHDKTLTAGLFGAKSNQRELWRVLLLSVVVLLFVELFVANRTLA